jgi:hypothetical protein
MRSRARFGFAWRSRGQSSCRRTAERCRGPFSAKADTCWNRLASYRRKTGCLAWPTMSSSGLACAVCSLGPAGKENRSRSGLPYSMLGRLATRSNWPNRRPGGTQKSTARSISTPVRPTRSPKGARSVAERRSSRSGLTTALPLHLWCPRCASHVCLKLNFRNFDDVRLSGVLCGVYHRKGHPIMMRAGII